VTSPLFGFRSAGDSNVGKVRTTNEDSMIVDPTRGLYVVLDGMGGANAGDVASQTARDAIHDFTVRNQLHLDPKALLQRAVQHGAGVVHAAAQASPEHEGMGTTVVGCLVVDSTRAIVAHVGDSRAYLLRGGRLQALTRDHTIVEELVGRGLLSSEEAERHPYKNVLSRNLGAKPEARIDVLDLEIRPGDRILLCSDGLYGYASTEAIQYVLGSGDEPEHVARDLIDLALRGGGGDNVTAIVIETPTAKAVKEAVQTSYAIAWWQRRERFAQVAMERGLHSNPICRGLAPAEALDLIANSLCQAVYHDLERSTGVNVWTFAQNIAGGWFERSGEWAPLRELLDILIASAGTIVQEIRRADPTQGPQLEISVSRALVVAELALGGLLAEQLRRIDAQLIALHNSVHDTLEVAPAEEHETADTVAQFIDQSTVPFLRPDRPVTNPGVNAEVAAGIAKTIAAARERTSPKAQLVKQVLTVLERVATDSTGNFATAVVAAREVYGVRPVDDAGVIPVFEALDAARIITAAAIHQVGLPEVRRARVLLVISRAQQRLVGAITGLVLEAVAPFSDRLKEAQQQTAELRERVAQAERKRADLERKLASSINQNGPWSQRTNTEW